MRRGERLAKLNALLLRVQTNSRERRAELGLPEAPAAEEPAPAPVVFVERRLVPPPPPSADDWTSLLAGELVEAPRADALRAGTTELEPEAGTPYEGDGERPPQPEARAAPAPLRTQEAEAQASREPPPISDAPEPSPESVLERAVRRATEGRIHELELFEEAAYELRERRSTIPPRDEAATESDPVSTARQAASGSSEPALQVPELGREGARAEAAQSSVEAPAPTPDEPQPSPAHDAAAHPTATNGAEVSTEVEHRSAAPHPTVRERRSPAFTRSPGQRRRSSGGRAAEPAPPVERLPKKSRTWLWGVGVIAVVAVFLGGKSFLGAGGDSHGATPPRATATATASEVLRVPSAAKTDARSAASPELGSAQHPSAAPPPIARPKEIGRLWVDVDEPADVYVQGLKVGVSGTYVDVPCGLKNVRVARSTPPPPGHSFPLWLGEAKSVLVPCGAENRVKLRPD